MKLTSPQLRALRLIMAKREDSAFSKGVLELHRLPGRMVDCYRVAQSLAKKGLVVRKGRYGQYLYITDAGRAVLAEKS